MHLYLVRHGESYVNLPDWNKGNSDEGLTIKGQRQARALADWFGRNLSAPDVIYSSTMQRARETAIPLAQVYNMPIIYEERVREIGNNQRGHEPFPSDALPQRYADYWWSERPFSPVSDDIENVESMIHFRARVGMFIEEIARKHRHEMVVVVCHGAVIDVIFDHIFDTGVWRRCEVWTMNTGLTHFEYVAHPNRETWRLRFYNRTEHLLALK